MELLFIYPADYFDCGQVDADYLDEYNALFQFPVSSCLFAYDTFIADNQLKLYPAPNRPNTLAVYRGWMMSPMQYQLFYQILLEQGIRLINSPQAYDICHLFPNAYPLIKNHTPKAIWFADRQAIDWALINQQFERFMIKDYVKSVKGSDFPVCFDTPVNKAEMIPILDQFLHLRAHLFTGGFLFKEYVPLCRYEKITNEYRAFYLGGQLLTLSQNSDQPAECPAPPPSLVNQFTTLLSPFYTVDFAQLDSGGWIVIETGDGQVSGLSPNQSVLSFYEKAFQILTQISNTPNPNNI